MTKQELSSRIAANIRARRKALKLSIRGLADRADVVEDYLGHIERGAKLPSLEVLDQIASGLGLGLEDLVKSAAPVAAKSASKRLYGFLSGMSESERDDAFAVLTKLKRPERLRALRVALGA